MTAIPRILVVDPAGRLGMIVRAAMSMLDRRYVLVEVPTASEALDEVFGTEVDLAVTTYTIDKSMTGIEWAERAIRERAGAQIIVVASDENTRPAPELVKNAFFQYISHASGEKFLRAIRIGLDGKDVVEAEETSGPSFNIGSVPELDLDGARDILIRTIGEIGAIGGLIADRAGRIVLDEGATSYVDKEMLAPLLGPSFGQLTKVSPQIGGNGWLLKYYEGDQYLLFGLSAGYHYFLMMLVSPSRGALGAVTRYGRQGARDLAELMGDSAWEYAGADEQVQEVETGLAPAVEKVEEPLLTPAEITSKLSAPSLEPVADIDIDSLFDSGGADDDDINALFDIDNDDLGLGDILDDGTVSFEEAQDMGLLGD